jgi:hypothetical protein
MQQEAVIRFLTSERMKAEDIHIELESVCGPEALPLTRVEKWGRCFQQGRMDPFVEHRSGLPLTNNLVNQRVPCLSPGRSVRIKYRLMASGFEREHGCDSFTRSSVSKSLPLLDAARSIAQP